MAPEYQYKSLTRDDEIRLLHLEPGSADDIHVTLHPVRLSEKPSYEAVSYYWGDPNDTRVVYCGGERLHITNSLYTGLRRLRREDSVRVLWADAVCINQNDTLERNAQVGLMSRIYSQPERILIWLGEDTEGIEGLHECINGALEVLPPEHFEFDELYPISTRVFREANRLRAEGKPNFMDHDWRPMNSLLCRPWFERRWIIQEVTLAEDSVPRLAICGDVEFSWSDLAAVTYRMASYGIVHLVAGVSTIDARAPYMMSFAVDGARPYRMLITTCMVYLMKKYRKTTATLVDCVTATALFKCGLAHDHLYSLLSVPKVPSAIVPDYRLSIEEVCMQFAETTLVSEQNLRLLSLAPHTSDPLYGAQVLDRRELPSWVPDLTCQGHVHPLVSYSIKPQLFHAGGEGRPDATVSADRRLLHVRGRAVDRVASMARSQVEVPLPTEEEIYPKTGYPALVKKRLANWLRECYDVAGEKYARKKGQERDIREESEEEAELRRSFLETLVCGMTMMRDPIPPEVLAAAQVYLDYLFDYFTEGYVLSEEVRETMLTYGPLVEQTLLAMTQVRRFGRTEQGRLCQVRTEAREGDVFVCIVGAEVPYLLRPSAEGRGVYTLIGDCFLQGVMQGEAFLDGRYETVDITIE